MRNVQTIFHQNIHESIQKVFGKLVDFNETWISTKKRDFSFWALAVQLKRLMSYVPVAEGGWITTISGDEALRVTSTLEVPMPREIYVILPSSLIFPLSMT